jgi:hypothetical protein
MYGNVLDGENQDWSGCIADQYGLNGNISLDPLFCDPTIGDYSLFNFSPCAPANNSCGQLMGAFDVGCTLSVNASLLDETSQQNVISHTPVLSWEPDPGLAQSEYEIEVGTDDDWAVAEMWDPDIVQSSEQATTYGGAPLLDGVNYYARLRLLLNGNWTPWYEISFRMNSVPSVPTVASPLNGTDTGPQSTLYVNNAVDPEDDQLWYQFEVHREPNMLDLVAASDLVPQQPDSTGWILPAFLSENEIYYWRCRAWDGYEYSAWPPGWFFSVDAMPEAPGNPSLVSPTGEDLILYDMRPTFSWTAVTDPDPFDQVHYRLELSLNQNFTLAVPFDGLTEASYQLPDSLAFDTHYWWRVKVVDLTDLYGVSDAADFWTWTLGDVNRTHDVTISDISLMIDHLFISGTPIEPPRVGDVNHSCDITISDVSRLVAYLFIDGTELLVGCE